MRASQFLCTVCLIGFLLPGSLSLAQPRKKISLNQNWKFHLGKPDANFYQKNYDDSQWETVHLPHTLALTSLTLDGVNDDKTQPTFHRNVGWYRKELSVSSNSNKLIYLEFEGAHQITDVWINGVHVGQHSIGGYTPFHFDITSYVKPGAKNQLTLLVDNRRNAQIPPDPGPFDYVKFSGLYRDVYLVEKDELHITFNWEALKAGVFITTPTVDPVNMNASIRVKTVVRNDYSTSRSCQVITQIADEGGLVVLKLTQEANIPPGQEHEFDQIGSIEDGLVLWDIDNPYLYRVVSSVVYAGEVVDVVENKLGIRKFSLDPQRGFELNHKPIELIGYNRHQQYPYIGDAVPNSLHYKDMLQFKELGFNIVRTAHYPQDDALIDACDELGILVYEEAPSWISISTDPQWWDNFEQSARVMVRNHRNHPSVVMWGGGINHRGYVARVHNAVKQEDPGRLTASQGSRWTGWQSSGLTDINANMLYGPVIWDRSEPLFAMEGRRGPEAVAKHKRDPLMTGLIAWPAHAYYTFHPAHDRAKDHRDRTRSGAMTIFRYPKKGLMWYPSELKKEPFIHIEEAWTPETQSLTVYSNGEEVELSVNGKPFARQRVTKDLTYWGLDHPPYEFDIETYEPGILEATAFNGGKVIASTKIRTPETPVGIRIELDTVGRDFVADGSDILLAYAHVVDQNNTTIRDANYDIHFTISGDATIVGDGKDIHANPMFTEYGVAPVLIRAGTTASALSLTAKSEGLGSTTVNFHTNAFNPDLIQRDAKPIYDFEKIQVDLGANNQLLQFGWTPWYTENNSQVKKEFDALGGFTAELKSGSGEMDVLKSLGEMNVIGKDGFVYGDGIVSIDQEGLVLTLSGLARGKYKLKTWHHAPKSNSDHMDPNKENLKKLTIDKIPYEEQVLIELLGSKKQSKVSVTEGKNMQIDLAATHELVFTSDGKDHISIKFSGKEHKGIWLNGFELMQWDM